MRKRFARHLRKEILRKGVKIIKEGYVLNQSELRYYETRKHKRGYEVNAELNGWQYYIAHPYDALGAYRFLLEAIKDNEYLLEKNPRGGVTWVI